MLMDLAEPMQVAKRKVKALACGGAGKGLVSVGRMLCKMLVGKDHLVRIGQGTACPMVNGVPFHIGDRHWKSIT